MANEKSEAGIVDNNTDRVIAVEEIDASALSGESRAEGDASRDLERRSYRLIGMSCASCARSIETTLQATPGVRSVTVNYASEKAVVELDPSQLADDDVVTAIRSAGYDAEPERSAEPSVPGIVTMRVNGMTCASCSASVEKTLKTTTGVESAAVNLATETASIRFDPARVRLSELKRRVKESGYELVESEQDDDGDRDLEKVRVAKKRLIIASVLAGTVMAVMIVHMFIVAIPGYLAIVAALGAPVVFGVGRHVHIAAFRAMRSGRPNMDVLVSLGSLPPFLIGLAGFFFPVQTFIEMATTIMTFHMIGKYLEVRAKGRASQAIRKLIEMGAKTANILVDGEETQIDVKELTAGDVMVV
ncbi:MAG: heavy metal translocating P-type ATPase, partial [Spirochaetaceae bacterium]